MTLPYYRRHVERWRSSPRVRLMGIPERGVFSELMDLSWQMGPIPDNPSDLARLIGVTLEDFESGWTNRVKNCWKKTKKGLINLQLEDERRWAISRTKKAKKAANVRHDKTSEDADAYADASPEHGSDNFPSSAILDIDIEKEKEKEEEKILPRKARHKGLPSVENLPKGWESWYLGITWTPGGVELTDEAWAGLGQRIGDIAEEERLPLFTDEEISSAMARMKNHFLDPTAGQRRRGPRSLPPQVVAWFEKDLRDSKRIARVRKRAPTEEREGEAWRNIAEKAGC